MRRMLYKGYHIEAHPYQLADSGEWTIEIIISLDKRDQITQRHFSAGNRYRIEDKAVQHCFNFGKQIIDGQVENCSVRDL